jgi:hypothetical protein
MPGCERRAGSEAAGLPDISKLVVVRPFLAALPGAGGLPRRLVGISEDCEEFSLRFPIEDEAQMVVDVQ